MTTRNYSIALDTKEQEAIDFLRENDIAIARILRKFLIEEARKLKEFNILKGEKR